MILLKKTLKGLYNFWWERRDSNPQALRQRILSPSCIPIPPLSHGGAYRSRTGVAGFADPCLTPRPTRHIMLYYTFYCSICKRVEYCAKICYDNSRYLTKYLLFARHGEIAQLVEQWPEEPRVLGSIPSLATSFN